MTDIKNIAVQDGKHSATKHIMDNIGPRVFSRSKGSNSYPALVRPNHSARTLLFAVVVAVTAGIPMAAGLHDPGHVLSTSICPGVLASPSPTNNTSNFDWQSVSRPLNPRTDACSPPHCRPEADYRFFPSRSSLRPISNGRPVSTATNAHASSSRSTTTPTAHPMQPPPSRSE